MRDFLPNTWTGFAEWVQNFTTQLGGLASKYSLTNEAAQLERDNLWVQYWVQAKYNAKAQEKQLNDFVEIVINGDNGEPSPTEPAWALPPNPPGNIQPGVKKRIRSLARQIKANPTYTRADGELMGIVAPEEVGLSPSDTAPEIRTRSLANYGVEISFLKFDFDALLVEFRYKNGNWKLGGVLTSSPGSFVAVPTTEGSAEQIEVRAIFLDRNQPYGNYSPIYNVVIQP